MHHVRSGDDVSDKKQWLFSLAKCSSLLPTYMPDHKIQKAEQRNKREHHARIVARCRKNGNLCMTQHADHDTCCQNHRAEKYPQRIVIRLPLPKLSSYLCLQGHKKFFLPIIPISYDVVTASRCPIRLAYSAYHRMTLWVGTNLVHPQNSGCN